MARKKKRKPSSKRYFGFGIVSFILGGFFITLTMLATTTLVKLFLAGFFFFIGIIDMVLYSIFRRK